MKRKKTTLIFIISTIITLLVVGIIVFSFRIIKIKNENTSTMTLALQTKKKEKDNALLFAAKITEIDALLTSMDSRFIDSDKIDTFVSYLEEIGPTLGSEITVKSVEVPEKVKNTIIFSLMITGSFNDVVKTIALIENIPYQININQVFLNKNLDPQKTENTKESVLEIPTWQADISFSILSLN